MQAHGVLLIEAPIERIEAEVARLKACMSEASEAVLGDGKVCRVDADIIRYPDRYMDEQEQEMRGITMSDIRAAQRAKRDELFLLGPVYFSWVKQNIPNPTSRLISVAQGFMGMSKPPALEITLMAKIWDCAGIESHDQRSRVLKKIDHQCKRYWVQRRPDRTAVPHLGTHSKDITRE